jgi:hypothetical protein
MMKKAIVGFVAVGAGIGLLLAARRMSQEMREHSKQMKAHCKQMAAHCQQMGAQAEEREMVGTA